MRFKNFVSILLVMALIFSFSACGSEKENGPVSSDVTSSVTSQPEESFAFTKDAEYVTLGKSVTLEVKGASGEVKFETPDMSVLSVSGNTVTVTPKTTDELTIKATSGSKAAICTVKAFENKMVTIDAKSELIKYHGRTELLKNGRMQFANTASGYEITFYGRMLVAEMNTSTGMGDFCIITDNDWENAQTTNIRSAGSGGKVVIAKYNEPEFHTVKVLKTKEESLEILNLNSLKVVGGGFLKAETNYDLVIEAIGDSITCGYGNMRPNTDTDNKDLQNGLYTYAAITARNLNAEYRAICRSGIGLYTHPGTFRRVMKDAYDYISTESEVLYKADKAPDVVILNLGTNDSWTGKEHDQYKKYERETFKAEYTAFIEKIVSKYGKDTLIVCCSGMMEMSIKNPIADVVADLSSKGYNVKEANFSKTLKGHPPKSDHERYAEKLTKDIKTWLGK